VFIFRLSSVLGGRSEVLNTPFAELLAHLEMLNEEKQAKRFADFMNMFYANPMTNKDARADYIKQIRPETKLLKEAKSGGLVTDLDQLRLLKQMREQEERAKGG
jgi:chromosome condensin MukBEF complex kleisin-like MukF subunit